MPVSVTPSAADEIRLALESRGGGLGIRLMVETSECDGMSYRLEYVDESDESDLVFECHGASVFVDPKSFVYVDGTEIDYAYDGMEGGFSINNPNAQDKCSCGQSFYV